MPTVKELKAEAKRQGYTGYSRLRKAELEELLGRPASRPARPARSQSPYPDVDERPSSSGPTSEMRFNSRMAKQPRMREVDHEIMGVMGLLNSAIGAPKQELWHVFSEVANRFREAIRAM